MKYELYFELNRIQCDPPKNWMDIKFESSFGNDVQPELDVDEFVFVNREAKIIFDFIELYGPFQAILFTIGISSKGEYKIWNCKLDLCDGLRVISPVEIAVKIKPDEGLDLIDSQLKAISYGFLAEQSGPKGFIDQEHYTDVPVVIRKKFDTTETAMAAISIFLITQQVTEFSKTFTQKKIDAIVTALSAPLQKPAEFFKMLAYSLLIIAYYAAMLVAIIRLTKTLFDNLFPKPTIYKGIKLRTALERALDYYNIPLESDIPELDYCVYLPSKVDDKIRKNRKDEGIPNSSDYGYQVSEMFELVLKLFRAKPVMQTNDLGAKKLIIKAEKNIRDLSTFVLPDVLAEEYTLNTNEMKANFLLTFQYDPSDEYTMPNARNTPFDSKKKDEEKDRYERGVSYEVITRVANRLEEDPQFDLLKNFEEVRIPMSLGNRRNNLSVAEQTLKVLTSLVDLVIKLFGGKTFAEKINEGKGRLIISQNSFNIPKLIVLQNGLIPQNHRDLMSAKALYNNYHYWRSFKTNPEYTQARVYENVKIPFSFLDYLKTNKSSYFKTSDGKDGQFLKLNWKMSDDYAIVSYKIFEKYTDNFTETIIEN